MSAAIGTRWKALSDDQKRQYDEAADEDKRRYKKDMEEYSEKLIREATEVRLASSERQMSIHTNTTQSQSSMDHLQHNTEAQHLQNTQDADLINGTHPTSLPQPVVQAVSTEENTSDLVQLLPFLLSLRDPIPQNWSVAELLEELQRIQYLTDVVTRNRVTQNAASETNNFMSILQLLLGQ